MKLQIAWGMEEWLGLRDEEKEREGGEWM